MKYQSIKPLFSFARNYPYVQVKDRKISAQYGGITLSVNAIQVDEIISEGIYRKDSADMDLPVENADLEIVSPDFESKEKVKVSKYNLEYFLKAIYPDEFRTNLNSLAFNEGYMVACDGHRLTYKESDIEGNYLIPRSAIKVLIQCLKKFKTKEIELEFSDNLVKAQTEDFTLFSKLHNTDYPKWQPLIPSDSKVIKDELFLGQLKPFSKYKPVLSKRNYGVVFEKADDCMVKMTIEDSLVKEFFEGKISKAFKVNYKYLTDADENGIVLKGDFGTLGAIQYKTTNFQGLIMPLKMD